MCDYSMHVCKTRNAEVNDVLEVASFFGTDTIGLHRVGDEHHLATCLQPGTFLEVDKIPFLTFISVDTFKIAMRRKLPIECGQAVRFVRLHEDEPYRHHDYLEWFTLKGQVKHVAITDLASGTFCVKQLPQTLKPGQIVDMSPASTPSPTSLFASTSASSPSTTPAPTSTSPVLEDA